MGIRNQSVAYDLSIYEKKAPVLKEVSATKSKSKQNVKKQSPVMGLLTGLVIVSIVSTMLYSRVVVTELNEEINSTKKELSQVVSETTRLESDLEGKMSLRNIEEYATTKLGLSKTEKNQIKYISLSAGNKVELPKDKTPNFIISYFNNIINKIQEYIL